MITPKCSLSHLFPINRKNRIFSLNANNLTGWLLAFAFLLPLNGLFASSEVCNESETVESKMLFGETFTAVLSGIQEVCPKITPASGRVTAVLHGNTLIVSGSFNRLTSDFVGAHIHFGMVGKNGPVTFVLKPRLLVNKTNGIFVASENTFHLQGEQAWDLKNRRFYVNIHSADIPSGELRGQLLPPADRYYHVNLLGKNEVPANASQAEGQVIFELNGDQLTAVGSFDGLSGDVALDIAGGAHIHHGFSGQNGPVDFLINLIPDADKRGARILPENNRWTLDHHQKKALLKEAFYVNIHSNSFRGGEIRGQLTSIHQGAAYEGILSGMQEVPSVGTNATGSIFANYDGGIHLRLSGSFKGLSSPVTGAHIHIGARGSNGPVVKVLNPRLDASKTGGVFEAHYNDFEVNQDQIDALFANGLYINIHTSQNPGGELRSQLIPLTLAKCGASFNKVEVAEENVLEREEDLMVAEQITMESTTNNVGLRPSNELAIVQDLNIFPNPASQELTIQYQPMPAAAQMTIFHVSGKQVLQQVVPASSSQQRVNVANLPVGLYLVTLQAEGEMPITKRLIKQ